MLLGLFVNNIFLFIVPPGEMVHPTERICQKKGWFFRAEGTNQAKKTSSSVDDRWREMATVKTC